MKAALTYCQVTLLAILQSVSCNFPADSAILQPLPVCTLQIISLERTLVVRVKEIESFRLLNCETTSLKSPSMLLIVVVSLHFLENGREQDYHQSYFLSVQSVTKTLDSLQVILYCMEERRDILLMQVLLWDKLAVVEAHPIFKSSWHVLMSQASIIPLLLVSKESQE